ncbi:unnamed protein product [Paramecium sonneborni]|uniref:Uncharacterized protein n=1 Tax=Paramecium sonneborni TaxID=65129 RepID=A0A8S1R9M4_9CILI|nr:unnamed protein product [Paramecium sonneborni]
MIIYASKFGKLNNYHNTITKQIYKEQGLKMKSTYNLTIYSFLLH